ncbi:MAG: iron ABC transporter permease [Chitinispirillia bacterium]|jgi:iron complex transport system permease protein
MHLNQDEFPEAYGKYSYQKLIIIFSSIILLAFIVILSISLGAVSIPYLDVVKTLIGLNKTHQWDIIVLNIRLPQVLTAIVAGVGLSVCGVAMQSILKNPLGSPFTLGISHAAAFGAALSVMIFNTGVMHSSVKDALHINNPYATTFSAFIFCLVATTIIMIVSKIKRASPEVIILTGVALGSLFTAGTMFMQYFADDSQLAAMVFWTFGDLGRSSWTELRFISVITFASLAFFFYNRWNYNAMAAGDETAKGLGVNVKRVRISGMIISSLLTAGIISFLGVIGFVGLVCPHMARRIIGDDHRQLIPFASIVGAILLLAADTAGRLVMSPHTLPVAILTSFLGAPVFIYLLVKKRHK